MPALTVSTDKPHRPNPAEAEANPSSTPPRPPFSPVTPVLSTATIASHSNTPSRRPSFMPEPSSASLSESSNTDIIALRSALTILQMQRKQAVHDIKTLQEMKQAAVAAPEAFAQQAASGKLRRQDRGGVLNLDPLLRDGDDDQGDEMEVDKEQARFAHDAFQFGTIPLPQNVVRTPPVNWAKYHIVGAPLDRMHEEQRRNPTPGEPRRDEAERTPDHVVVAPYRPFVDKIEGSGRTRSTGKKG